MTLHGGDNCIVDAAHDGGAEQGIPAVHATAGRGGREVADKCTMRLEVTQQVVEVLADAPPGLQGSWDDVQATSRRVAFELFRFGMLTCHAIHRGGLSVLARLLRVADSCINEQGGCARCSGHDVHDCLFSGGCCRGWARFDTGPGGDMHFSGRLVVGIPKNAAEGQDDRVVSVHASTTQSTCDSVGSKGVHGCVADTSRVRRDMQALRCTLCDGHPQTPGQACEELWIGHGVLMQEGGKPSTVARTCCAAQAWEVSFVRVQQQSGVVDCLHGLHSATLDPGDTLVRQCHQIKRHTTDRWLKAGRVGWRGTQTGNSKRSPLEVNLQAKFVQCVERTLSRLDGEGPRSDGVRQPMLAKPGLDHGVRLDGAGQWRKGAEILAAGDAEPAQLQREVDLLHLAVVKGTTHQCLNSLLDKVIKLLCVNLDVQVRGDASIIIKLVREQAGNEDKNGLTTGSWQGCACQIAYGSLQLGGFGHALGNGS